MLKKVITLIQTFTISLLPLMLNGFNVSLSIDSTSPLEENNHFNSEYIPTHWLETVRKVIKESQKSEKPFEVKTVVIDAGHGGHDPGCSGANSREKHIALAISQKLALYMRERFPNLQVILTRDEDVFIPLQERAAIANRNNADMFISIHCNYMPGSGATKGTETYVMGLHTANENLEVAKRENAAILHEDNYVENYGGYDPNSTEGHIMLSMFQNAFLEQSILLADKVEKKFGESERKTRGVKQAGFLVLRETAMPSILVEAGFLSSKYEEGFLKTEEGQEVIANSILEAFVEYKYEVEAGDLTSAPILANEVQQRKGLQPIQTSASPFNSTSTAKATVVKSTSPPSTPSYQQEAIPMNVATDPAPNFYNYKPSASSQQTGVKPEPMIIPIQHGGMVQAPRSATAETAVETTLNQTAYASEVNNPVASSSTDSNRQNIRFCVQLAASPRPLETSSYKWQSIDYRIEVIQENQMYKYQARHFLNFQQAFSAKVQVQKQGFKDAFIVAYKNGEKIPLEEAKQALGL